MHIAVYSKIGTDDKTDSFYGEDEENHHRVV